MAADPIYPFGLPSFSPSGSSAQANPLAASLELMQRALNSFGQSASLASDSMAQSMNPEDLEKRIADLRAVENWLKLNLSMLSSSIQGLEVQLATIKTLRTFVEMGAQNAANDNAQASPLEVVLGLKKPNRTKPAHEETAHAQAAEPAAEATASAEPTTPLGSTMNTQAAQAWWDMLQTQFSQMAQATTQAASFAQKTAKPASTKPTTTKHASAKPAVKRARRTASPKPSTAATKAPPQNVSASRSSKK